MLTIAICDDESEQRTALGWLIREYLGRRPELSTRLSIFSSSAALLGTAEDKGGFDLYLLDVLMPELSGIDLGVRLRELDQKGIIIYLSNSSDYAVDSYRVRAFDYLLKPVLPERLFPVLDQALALLDQRKSAQVMVKTRSGARLLPIDDIRYMELVGRTARYHLSGGETVDSVTLRVCFQEAASPLLADPRFLLCGSSLVVNLHHVFSVEGNCFCLTGGDKMVLPRRSAVRAKQAWASYWLSGGQAVSAHSCAP